MAVNYTVRPLHDRSQNAQGCDPGPIQPCEDPSVCKCISGCCDVHDEGAPDFTANAEAFAARIRRIG